MPKKIQPTNPCLWVLLKKMVIYKQTGSHDGQLTKEDYIHIASITGNVSDQGESIRKKLYSTEKESFVRQADTLNELVSFLKDEFEWTSFREFAEQFQDDDLVRRYNKERLRTRKEYLASVQIDDSGETDFDKWAQKKCEELFNNLKNKRLAKDLSVQVNAYPHTGSDDVNDFDYCIDLKGKQVKVFSTLDTKNVLTPTIYDECLGESYVSLNPLLGCTYKCTNCSIPNSPTWKYRFESEHGEFKWGNVLWVYKNAPKEVERQLKVQGEANQLKGKRIICSSFTDPFCLEQYRKKEQGKNYLAETLSKLIETPIFEWILFCTKSPVVASNEFIELFKKFNTGKIEVYMSISSDIEGGYKASVYDHSPNDLLSAATKLKSAGIPVRISVNHLRPHTPDFPKRLAEAADWVFVKPEGTPQVHKGDTTKNGYPRSTGSSEEITQLLNTIQKNNGIVRVEPQFYHYILSEIVAVGKFTDDELASQIALLKSETDTEIIESLKWLKSHGLQAARPNVVSALEELLCAEGERESKMEHLWPIVANMLSSLGAAAATDRVINRLKDMKGSYEREEWSTAATEALKHFASPSGRLIQQSDFTWQMAPIPNI